MFGQRANRELIDKGKQEVKKYRRERDIADRNDEKWKEWKDEGKKGPEPRYDPYD